MFNLNLSPIQEKVLRYLYEPRTCTEVGETVFENPCFRTRQAFARPAGKVIRGLERLGLVCMEFDKFREHIVWKRTRKGEVFIRTGGV